MKVIAHKLYVKLVFFGPAMAGKTEVMKYIFNHVISENMKLSSGLKQVNTTTGRTLLFDFTPIKLRDNIMGRFFSVTGQDYYRGTRNFSMLETDAVFFILDAQKNVMERNMASYAELNAYIKSIPTLKNAPVILLVNKWNMKKTLPINNIISQLELKSKWPYMPVNALSGYNIKKAFDMMMKSLGPQMDKLAPPPVKLNIPKVVIKPLFVQRRQYLVSGEISGVKRFSGASKPKAWQRTSRFR